MFIRRFKINYSAPTITIIKAKIYPISSNTHQLQFIKLHHFTVYTSTCHERTPSGPGKIVRTLQVAAHQR